MIGKVLVGMAAVLALIGLASSKAKTASAAAQPATKTPQPATGTTRPSTTKTTKTTKTASKTPTTPKSSLTAGEQLQLSETTGFQLYQAAMISSNKVFVVAAANKLATSGDTEAANELNARVAQWSTQSTVGLSADEQDMLANPTNYTLDQVISEASQSSNAGFVKWAAGYVRQNGRTDSADVLDQLAAGMTGG